MGPRAGGFYHSLGTKQLQDRLKLLVTHVLLQVHLSAATPPPPPPPPPPDGVGGRLRGINAAELGAVFAECYGGGRRQQRCGGTRQVAVQLEQRAERLGDGRVLR